MLGAMRRILEHRNDSPLYLVGCTYLFFDAFLRSAESHRIPQTTRLHGFYIDSALSFIEKNYQADVSIEDIARYIGLNRSYFGKVFKEGMGVSPQQFLIGYRMEKACELLKLSSLSIGEVGRSVGYPNQLHFSRAFRITYGTSPRTYWRSYQANPQAGSSNVSSSACSPDMRFLYRARSGIQMVLLAPLKLNTA